MYPEMGWIPVPAARSHKSLDWLPPATHRYQKMLFNAGLRLSTEFASLAKRRQTRLSDAVLAMFLLELGIRNQTTKT